MLKGSCRCGRVKYEASGEPIVVAHCHCIDCQKRSGAGHTTGAMFLEKNFILQGALSKFSALSEEGKTTTHYFCTECGSPIYGKNTKMPKVVTLSAGTLEEPNKLNPEVTIFSKNKNHWDRMDNSIETYDDMPDWKPKLGE